MNVAQLQEEFLKRNRGTTSTKFRLVRDENDVVEAMINERCVARIESPNPNSCVLYINGECKMAHRLASKFVVVGPTYNHLKIMKFNGGPLPFFEMSVHRRLQVSTFQRAIRMTETQKSADVVRYRDMYTWMAYDTLLMQIDRLQELEWRLRKRGAKVVVILWRTRFCSMLADNTGYRLTNEKGIEQYKPDEFGLVNFCLMSMYGLA